jgi:hypothetical protein
MAKQPMKMMSVKINGATIAMPIKFFFIPSGNALLMAKQHFFCKFG